MKQLHVPAAPVGRCSMKAQKRYRKAIWERDSVMEGVVSWVRCCWCPQKLQRHEFTIEHIQPLSLGGTYDLANLAAACRKCNHEYGTLTEKIVTDKRAALAAQREMELQRMREEL